MSNKELKSLLHEGIENIDDKDFLVAIQQLLEKKYATAPQPKLTKSQLKRIEESKKQIQNGDFFSEAEADKLVDSWLKK